jgi:hypothetical protein
MSDKKSSTTVVVRRIKRHRAPGSSAPPAKVSHYGNGWNGGNKRPANQPQPTQNQTK